MASINIDLDMKRTSNQRFISKADEARPPLLHEKKEPEGLVSIDKEDTGIRIKRIGALSDLSKKKLGKEDRLCLDFGHHLVGYVTLSLSSVGSPQDAPAYIRLKFGEIAKEITEESKDYDGWISKGWIQEEYIHIDVLPAKVTLPRRYAFRFLEIYVLDTSLKWKLIVDEVTCETVSAVDMNQVKEISPLDPMDAKEEGLLKAIDNVGLRTLQNCMQDVFEDGPKRDRRLWLGDLRLQAKANYETYSCQTLVKRCLYLFAGLTRDDGRIGACLFTQPSYIVDDTFFFDYSLFFVSTLYDYYVATGDMETLVELWPSARRQIELASDMFDEEGRVQFENDFACFVDWKEGLDKHASALAIYIYCLKDAKHIVEILDDKAMYDSYEKEIRYREQSAYTNYWDEHLGLFVSGNEHQVSYASQVWMILAKVVTKDQGHKMLRQLHENEEALGMVSPYMNHHYVEALLQCGESAKAIDYIEYYWGGMIKEGADTFWELYDPDDPESSPYGSSMVNSYCHAWSCTPSYLLRKMGM